MIEWRGYQSETIKKCGKCREEKPISDFSKNRSRKDGYNNRCNKCCKSHKRKPNTTCLFCKTKFYSSGGRGSYCSHECVAFVRDSRQWTTCLTCGAEFQVHLYEYLDPDRGKYCSQSCGMKARSGEDCASWRGGPLDRVCESCGEHYEVKRYRSKSRFCSPLCTGSGKRGDKSPMWKGGISGRGYPETWNASFKKLIRVRENYKCAICGGRGLSVHHIDAVKENTYRENCITLCNSCHGKAHGNMIYWVPILSAMAKEREGINV